MITAAVVDDDIDTARVFAEYLEILGASVVSVGYDGKQAVEIYKKYKPDVMFLDLLMPEYDGIYALGEIRHIDPTARVVIFTADLNADSEERLDKLNPNKILFKPFDIEKIGMILDDVTKPVFMVDNAKKALVSFTITQTLLGIGQSATNEVGNRLYAKYHCYFPDCLEHPEYLKDILEEIFGNGSVAVIRSIKQRLAEFEDQQPISNFLSVISR